MGNKFYPFIHIDSGKTAAWLKIDFARGILYNHLVIESM